MESVESNLQGAIVRGNGIRIVPFKIFCHTVPQIHRVPIRVVTIIERPTRGREFVREGKLPGVSMEILLLQCLWGSVWVDQRCSQVFEQGLSRVQAKTVARAGVCLGDIALNKRAARVSKSFGREGRYTNRTG